MKLIVKLNQYRYDFQAILECEFCGTNQFMDYGYDDMNFHNNVIPAIQCVSCGKRSVEIIPEGISDPGTQGGIKVQRKTRQIEEEYWEREDQNEKAQS